MADINATLAERGARYGDFTDHARVTMSMIDILRTDKASGYNEAPNYVRLAIDVILNKIARACTGDPLYNDNWHDIIGYAKLVEDRVNALCPVAEAVMPEVKVKLTDDQLRAYGVDPHKGRMSTWGEILFERQRMAQVEEAARVYGGQTRKTRAKDDGVIYGEDFQD